MRCCCTTAAVASKEKLFGFYQLLDIIQNRCRDTQIQFLNIRLNSCADVLNTHINCLSLVHYKKNKTIKSPPFIPFTAFITSLIQLSLLDSPTDIIHSPLPKQLFEQSSATDVI